MFSIEYYITVPEPIAKNLYNRPLPANRASCNIRCTSNFAHDLRSSLSLLNTGMIVVMQKMSSSSAEELSLLPSSLFTFDTSCNSIHAPNSMLCRMAWIFSFATDFLSPDNFPKLEITTCLQKYLSASESSLLRAYRCVLLFLFPAKLSISGSVSLLRFSGTASLNVSCSEFD